MQSIMKMLPEGLKHRLVVRFFSPDMEWSMRNLRLNGFRPRKVIDVGAYRGEWACICKSIFPETAIMMIEPQASENRFLKQVCKKYADCYYVNALVGAEKKKVPFRIDGTCSQVLREETDNDIIPALEVPLVTLDNLIKGTIFERIQLLKLDVQGYELEVLKGAKSMLGFAEVIIMEVSIIMSLIKGAPSFCDVISFMYEQDFILHDVCSFMRRPSDYSLWQIDAIFVKNTSQLCAASKEWW